MGYNRFFLNIMHVLNLNKGRNKLASPQFKQRTKQRSSELNICLHNVRSARNKTKDVNALLEVNESSFGVFLESWITNNS